MFLHKQEFIKATSVMAWDWQLPISIMMAGMIFILEMIFMKMIITM